MDQTIDGNYDQTANVLGLDDGITEEKPSTYWGDLDGDDLGVAIVDRFERLREWQSANGLLRGWRLKLHYYHNEYRTNYEIPHLPILQQWGSQGEFQFVSINVLRSILKTILASVVQNPPSFQPRAVNADADAMEAASLYQGVLDYYSRDLRLPAKINKAAEMGLVVDQSYVLVEWDPMARDGQEPEEGPAGIWTGAPRIKVLTPWDVCYDMTKESWSDLDYVIVRDWVDKERLKSQFPEYADDIEGCRLKAQVVNANHEYEGLTRYELSTMSDMSNDVQVFKLFHKSTSYMPNGRFCMALENGKLLFESPVGLMYPRLPVERFVPDEQVDLLAGYSPINELLGVQESINAIASAITTNANNYSNQYIAVEQGTDLNPRTLANGHTIIEYPPGRNPPQGINLTAIPPTLFQHLKELQGYMESVPGVSNASRGQAPGANSTGSAMLFLAGQTTQNQGAMSANYAAFCASVMTSLLHVLRVFGRTERTINVMGKTVASRTIVLAEALKDFDEVVVDLTNPILSTPQGRMGFATQMMQFGNATPMEALQVATSGNLGPAVDPAREEQYELQSENEWLMDGQEILVNALDNHQQHIQMHQRLFATPWLRNPAIAAKLGIQNASQIMTIIQQHIMQHMQFMQGNQTNQIATTAGQQPGQPETPPQPALGHAPPAPPPNGAAPVNAPAQGQQAQVGSHLPNMPTMPHPQQGG